MYHGESIGTSPRVNPARSLKSSITAAFTYLKQQTSSDTTKHVK